MNLLPEPVNQATISSYLKAFFGFPEQLTGVETMLLVSVGMPRAGSGWHYNLIHDLLLAGGHQDARLIRQRYRLQRFLTEVNCNIGSLTARRLLPVLAPSLLGNTYAIKAHAGPTPTWSALNRLGLARTTYIYRDPRDAMLSAYEHGQRARRSGHQNAFAKLESFEDALAFMQQYLDIWQAWMDQPQVLSCRYEDLLTDYDRQARQLLEFLQLPAQSQAVQQVVQRYRPEQSRQAEQRGLHFRQGKIGRFERNFSTEQQQAANLAFAPFLEKMGYQ